MRRVLVGVLLAACGAAPRGASGPRPVVFLVRGGVAVPIVCPACALELPADARVRLREGTAVLGPAAASSCGPEGRALAQPDGTLAVWPADAGPLQWPGRDVKADHLARVEQQLLRTDPSLHGPAVAHGALHADLDGDGQLDAAYAAGVSGLEATLVVASSAATRIRILQFSDLDAYELLGAVDVDGRKGLELVVRSGPDTDVVRATGEVLGHLHCR